jgi:aspartyl-tRNA(Asn)/glutamyl-tRNA(Gln) amidotransferase subunit B
MEYEIVIGLEIHAELKTRTKMFCNCRNEFGAKPNTLVCPVCLAMPGALPAMNRTAVEYAIRAGLAMNCSISSFTKMDRKNYFYPDLPRAYQISQYDRPLCYDGYVDIDVNGQYKRIGIERIHLEEDAGKLIHDACVTGSLVDYNRCGVPLIEIVSRPDISSPEEARIFLETIKTILEYVEVSDCKMQEGSLRADVNLSVRKPGDLLGTRTEMKNINSLHAVLRAAQAEADRQAAIISDGGSIIQETRRWDDSRGESYSMRNKEEALDYRFFPEPDLVPVVIEKERIEEIRKDLPELPTSRKDRYINDFGIPWYDAQLITQSRPLADMFETAVGVCGNPKLVSNWIMTDIMRRINEDKDFLSVSSLDGKKLGRVLDLLHKGDITPNSAKEILDILALEGGDPDAIIEKRGLKVQRDESLIAKAVGEVLDQNPQAVADYRSGKEKAFGFLMGRTMAALKGRADPAQVREMLIHHLNKQ